MSTAGLNLKPVDRVEVLFLTDNYVDSLLPNQECVIRPPLSNENGHMDAPLLAEHACPDI